MVPFEAWIGMRPSFNHFHVLSCNVEARFYNPTEKKLDPRTTSCKFIGYSEKFKGYKFYCPNSHSRVMETHYAKFLEDEDETNISTSTATSLEFEEISHDNELLDQQASSIAIPIYLQPHPSHDNLYMS